MAHNEHPGSGALRRHSLVYMEPTELGSHASTQLLYPLACCHDQGKVGWIFDSPASCSVAHSEDSGSVAATTLRDGENQFRRCNLKGPDVRNRGGSTRWKRFSSRLSISEYPTGLQTLRIETLAASALKFAAALGFNKVVLKGDCEVLMKALKGGDQFLSTVGLLMDDFRYDANLLYQLPVTFI